MKQLRVFFAGKVDVNSSYAPVNWRENLSYDLNAQLETIHVTDISYIHRRNAYIFDNKLPVSAMFSQSCFYIQYADVLVVNLTDDISVGGSQEIMLAKLLGVPVIGLAARDGKFNKLRYELGGNVYWNWTHPFVGALCNLVVQSTEELAQALDDFENIPKNTGTEVSDAVNYYQQNASAFDTSVNRILSFDGKSVTSKPKLRIYFAGKMGKAGNYSKTAWRDELASQLSEKSRYGAVNLDFLEVTHAAIRENDPVMIFGRDAYLIRSSDIVVVNLSDDISVGGSVEMLLAKLYHRPLIGIAQVGGKFVAPEHIHLGRKAVNYVNPFVSTTCDWLIHDPAELPGVIDNVFTRPVKDASIVPASLRWYRKRHLPRDRTAQTLAGAAA